MKILITGSNGLLGSTLFDYLTLKGEFVERFNRNNFSWKSHKLNINQFIGFDYIIHTAANTNVEVCELDPISCYKDNALLTERLAYAASEAKCKFIYISSTGIYGTEKISEPYSEYDKVNPTTHHHRSKWLGEQAVNKYIKNALIIRTGWIFGGNPDNPKNFVARRIEEALDSALKQIQSNTEQKGVPTFVNDLAVKLYELLKNNEVGTFNLVNQGSASRFDYVSKIIEITGLNVTVLPVIAKNFNRKAQVSNNEVAIALKMQQLGYKTLPIWHDSLKQYIEDDLSGWLKKKTQ